MLSEYVITLIHRVYSLKLAFLPAINKLGLYSTFEADRMRAFRLLMHAEVEHYIETVCEILTDDLDREIASVRRLDMTTRSWASRAVKESRVARNSNHGVKRKDILAMFEPLGYNESFFDNNVDRSFLDRMETFGKNRGDVAHSSATKATYTLNSAREHAVAIELMTFLLIFDEVMFSRRIQHVLV